MTTLTRARGATDPRGASRIVAIVVTLGCVAGLSHPTESCAQYHFRLTKGKGTPVCSAYQKNLDSAGYAEPPYCGIPDGDTLRGFEKLTKVPLKPEDVERLWPHVFEFDFNQNQFLIAPNFDRNWPSPIARQEYGKTVVVWKYDPPVSMSNDGTPDNILMWHGFSISSTRCGDQEPAGPSFVTNVESQRGYVLAPDDKTIDETKTRELFGSPNAAPPPSGYDSRGKQQFIFKYHGMLYLAAFFYRPNQQTPDMLQVFLRQKEITRELCEYRVIDLHIYQ